MRNEEHFGRIVARALVLLVCTAPGAPLSAQDAIRGYDSYSRFDTSAFEQPALDLSAISSALVLLRADGRIFALGSTRLPVAPPAPPGTSYTSVRLGGNNYPNGQCCFALLSDGNIVCYSDGGPLLPAPALPAGVTYTQLEVGYAHALALRSDGVAVAWGDNSVGQATVPAVPPGVAIQRIYARGGWSMLLLSNGALLPFGNNNNGQLNVPALPAGVTYTDAWPGARHAIARRSDGALVGWGDNLYGQGVVPALPSGVTYTTLGLGYYHTVAVRSDGVVLAWGYNGYGITAVPALPPGTVASVVCGDMFTVLRFTNGAVLSWGTNMMSLPLPVPAAGERWTGIAGGGRVYALSDQHRLIAIAGDPAPPLPPGIHWTAVAGGSRHAVGLRSDGRAYAWGDNSVGQCAIPPLPPGMICTAIDAAGDRTALLRSDGIAVQFGGGAAPSFTTPPASVSYTGVSCGSAGVLLLRSDGAVEARYLPSNNQQIQPALPPGLAYTQVAMARSFTAALRSDGEVQLWGSLPSTPLPPLPSGVVYVQIDGGEDLLVARRSDGVAVTASSYPIAIDAPAAGESYVEVKAGYSVVLRVGPTSTYVTYASGCPGSLPSSRLVPHETPRIGQELDVEVFDLPQHAAVMVFGWQRLAPVSLAPVGMPGCLQHVGIAALVPIFGHDHSARFRLAIPNNLAVLGLSFTNQAIVLDPFANAAGAVVSDAAEGTIGQR